MKALLTKLLLMLAVISCWSQPKGKIVKIDGFKSKFVQSRNIEIWLPNGYDTNTKTSYPVLYMQDGQNVFNPETSIHRTAWEADAIAERLTAIHQIQPVIIVAIWNTDNRYMEYFPEKASLNFVQNDQAVFPKATKDVNPNGVDFLGDEYLKFITQELKPYIDKQYRTKTEAESTAICGSSMGALISLYAICEYPEIFGQAACLSTHWTLLPDAPRSQMSEAFKKYLYEHLPSPENHRIYFDYGTKTLDQYYGVHQRGVDNMMKNKGYTTDNWTTKKFEGEAHVEKAWQKRFDQVLFFLFKSDNKKAKTVTKEKTSKKS
ncbi:alpha/beta hydrolase [Flavobacterium sp. AG291]|uniref:alpha/beta hydrolase n=1 Tax=Flavobacterium sp. AG291 TaxID=2184000 RepID=UPI000E0C0C4E|nr:alpha/beta hydrolase-fold protein [Flavobacterium sp. AG291]RDI13292.1 putative esterase [Flavobacterium sp. AG291]